MQIVHNDNTGYRLLSDKNTNKVGPGPKYHNLGIDISAWPDAAQSDGRTQRLPLETRLIMFESRLSSQSCNVRLFVSYLVSHC